MGVCYVIYGNLYRENGSLIYIQRIILGQRQGFIIMAKASAAFYAIMSMSAVNTRSNLQQTETLVLWDLAKKEANVMSQDQEMEWICTTLSAFCFSKSMQEGRYLLMIHIA